MGAQGRYLMKSAVAGTIHGETNNQRAGSAGAGPGEEIKKGFQEKGTQKNTVQNKTEQKENKD